MAASARSDLAQPPERRTRTLARPLRSGTLLVPTAIWSGPPVTARGRRARRRPRGGHVAVARGVAAAAAGGADGAGRAAARQRGALPPAAAARHGLGLAGRAAGARVWGRARRARRPRAGRGARRDAAGACGCWCWCDCGQGCRLRVHFEAAQVVCCERCKGSWRAGNERSIRAVEHQMHHGILDTLSHAASCEDDFAWK